MTQARRSLDESQKETAPAAYSPALPEGTRVRLVKEGHVDHLRVGTVKRALVNPSQKGEHQWYDVLFDIRNWGRFRQGELEVINLPSNR